MRTQWTSKGNRDAGSSCSCDRGLHRHLRNFGGGGLNTPNPPLSVRHCLQEQVKLRPTEMQTRAVVPLLWQGSICNAKCLSHWAALPLLFSLHSNMAEWLHYHKQSPHWMNSSTIHRRHACTGVAWDNLKEGWPVIFNVAHDKGTCSCPFLNRL